MVRKSDWFAVYRGLLASRRPTFASPPTTEELVAYTQDELPPEEASRIQEYLAFHPELARALAEPVPEPDEIAPGDPAFLLDPEVESDWTRLQDRIGDRRRSWTAQHALALAASLLAVLFLGLYLQTQRQVQRLAQELREPLVNPEHRLLLPDGQRGAAQPPISLPAAADHFLLKPALVGHPDFPDYRLEIIDTTGGASRVVWDRKGLRRLSDDTFEIWMPRAFLSAEEYRLELYGVDGGRETRLATYSLRLPRF